MHEKYELILTETAQLFKLLGDPKRLLILRLLQRQEHNVTEISKLLGIEQSAVSHQLKLLREHHLVATRREGKSIYYRLDDEHVGTVLLSTFAHVTHTLNEQVDE